MEREGVKRGNGEEYEEVEREGMKRGNEEDGDEGNEEEE